MSIVLTLYNKKYIFNTNHLLAWSLQYPKIKNCNKYMSQLQLSDLINSVILFLDFPDPVIIDIPSPNAYFVPVLSALALAILGAYWFLRRNVRIDLYLQLVIVRTQDERFYLAVVDKNNLSGYYLWLLYSESSKVRGCYITLNGHRAYALLDTRPDPVTGHPYIIDSPSHNQLDEWHQVLDIPNNDYITSITFPGPNPLHWESLSHNIGLKLYNERPVTGSLSNIYVLDPIYPSMDENDEFTININMWRHNFNDDCYLDGR